MFLLLENVAGFETSKARDQVCESVLSYNVFSNKKHHSCTLYNCMHQDDDIKVVRELQQVKTSLEAADFECREFLLCPRQISIPNSRLRLVTMV